MIDRLVTIIVIGACVCACEKSPEPRPPLRDVSPETFSRLRVVHGRWLGGWGSGKQQVAQPYLEEYRLVDDSTITIMASPDTLASKLEVAGQIVLRQGMVRYKRGVTELLAVGIGVHSGTFLPVDGVVGGFTYNTANGPLVMTWHGPPVGGLALRDTVRVFKPVGDRAKR